MVKFRIHCILHAGIHTYLTRMYNYSVGYTHYGYMSYHVPFNSHKKKKKINQQHSIVHISGENIIQYYT